MINLMLGDCLERMKEIPDNSIDSIVTDPPYGLSFMGKKWDYDVPSVEIWQECLRVLKPGGHLLAFAGTRTQHRMACRIEDAGFEIRDMMTHLYDTNDAANDFMQTLSPEQHKLMARAFSTDGMIGWGYGSGFPKSLNISKAIDKAAGAEREVIGQIKRGDVEKAKSSGVTMAAADANKNNKAIFGYGIEDITAPSTDEAKQWDGWGTALKPALEPITVARKPLSEKTVAANVLKHGAGGINIDGCRVETNDNLNGGAYGNGNKDLSQASSYATGINAGEYIQPTGRFPANLIHDGSEDVLALFPSHKDAASSARFFYCAKTSKKDRNEGCENLPLFDKYTEENPQPNREIRKQNQIQNNHPTVKPTELMRYLCRLVTPAGGTVLDPFTGSGSTGKAAMSEGFKFIGIELDEHYFSIAKARIEAAQAQHA